MTAPVSAALAVAIEVVEASVAQLPPLATGSAWGASRDRRMVAVDALCDHLSQELDARIADDWRGSRVTILGISSSSTTGVTGALGNWIVAARKRL